MFERALASVLRGHLTDLRQMAFVSGPRQVGKTTLCRGLSEHARYLDWDDPDDRRVILGGTKGIADFVGLDQVRSKTPILVLDELHKYRRWKSFLKGLYDHHGHRLRMVVTGSARLDVFRRGGDSLMGRYLPYRLHPLSAGELVSPTPSDAVTRAPTACPDETWDALLEHGGFPDPLVRADPRFSRRWRKQRTELLVQQDIRDLTRIQELDQLEVLVQILGAGSGSQLNYTRLAKEARTSVDTMRRWVATLCAMYHGFLVRPWFRNVARSLRKEPKWYLRDWSGIEDPGARAETFVACHLLKAVDVWTDAGLGDFELRYLRDKERHEVDFAVIRDGRPWLLVEAKRNDAKLSPNLARFADQVGAPHALQVVLDLPHEDVDCFTVQRPAVVPARTLLTQLP